MNATITRAFAFLAVLSASLFTTASAQSDTQAEVTDDATGETRTVPLLNAEQLDELLGPIALYPDALIALILPAATMPTDLVLASRYLSGEGDKSKVDEQPWDESVRSLAHYPDVVTWMDGKLSWAIMVGDAFIAQPVDVMQSIQRLRARARAAGTLVDSEQQKVVEEEGNIRIVPAQPEVIYVPVYDPRVVYVERAPSWGWSTSVISYRWCYPTGIWLSYDCDWYGNRIWVVNSHHRHHWYHDHGWRRSHHHRRHDYYDRDGFGRSWMPRHDHRRPDYRRDHRDRDSHVIVRDGRREFPDRNRRDHDRDHDRRDGRHVDRDHRGDRGLGGNFVDNAERERVTRVEGTRGERTPGRAHPNAGDRAPGGRGERANRPERRSDSPAPVVSAPEAPRVTSPTPRVTAPRHTPPAVRESEAPRAPSGGSNRWIDRATRPSSSARARVESSTPRVAPEAPRASRPTPRASAPAPRAEPPTARAPSPRPAQSQVVRIPVPGGGSRTTVVNQTPSAGNPSRSSHESRGEDRGRRGGEGRERSSRDRGD